MKRLLFTFLTLHAVVFSQDITGDWSGEIDAGSMKLGFGMHIYFEGGFYRSVMDIPDQNAMGIPMSSTSFANNKLTIESKEMQGIFKGIYENDQFSGTFHQNGAALPFVMRKGLYEKKVANRPQEPKPPFNYEIKEVMFVNKKENIEMAGTLTIPRGKGPFPAVVLVSGSGQQDRNSEIMQHKPFWIIADYLTQNGIAVLRYDDRGVGGSKGNPSTCSSVNFANDAQAAVAFLQKTKGINKKKIGIIGHSEGGMIAPMVAANPKNKIGFLVLLAGPAISGGEILLKQQELIAAANGESDEDILLNRKMTEAMIDYLKEYKGSENLTSDFANFIDKYLIENDFPLPENMTSQQMAQTVSNSFATPWMKYFLVHDPKDDILKVKCPVLALNGAKDLQVPSQLNLTTFNRYAEISGNTNFLTKEFPDLNHLFQHCITGSPNEYAEIEETFSPEVLAFFKDWILNLK